MFLFVNLLYQIHLLIQNTRCIRYLKRKLYDYFIRIDRYLLQILKLIKFVLECRKEIQIIGLQL